MLQSAIFADLQVNNFGIPSVRLMPRLPLLSWTKDSFAALTARLRGQDARFDPRTLSEHLRRDIGIVD